MKKFLALTLSDVEFIMLINVKMPTKVGILTFMSRINFVLSMKTVLLHGGQSVSKEDLYTLMTGYKLIVGSIL